MPIITLFPITSTVHTERDELDQWTEKLQKVAWTLGEIGDERAVDLLLETFDRLDLYHKDGAAEALGKIGAHQAFVPLIVTLKKASQENLHGTRIVSAFLAALVEILEKAPLAISTEALEEASGFNDVRVLITKTSPDAIDDEDQFGRHSYHPTYDVEESVDFSSLRKAALRELERRHRSK